MWLLLVLHKGYFKDISNPKVGIPVVCAAGNFGGDQSQGADKIIRWPARYQNTIAVGGTTQNDSRWNTTSKLGSMVGDQSGVYTEDPVRLDFVAPGDDGTILSTNSDGGYGLTGMTSAATAHATGVIALIKSLNSELG